MTEVRRATNKLEHVGIHPIGGGHDPSLCPFWQPTKK